MLPMLRRGGGVGGNKTHLSGLNKWPAVTGYSLLEENCAVR